jgi:hypothetical protein
MGLFGNKQQSGEKPLYENSYAGFWIKVYSSRIEFRSGPTVQSISLNQVASVEQGSFGLAKVTIETAGGKRYTLPTTKKKEVQQAILDAQAKFSHGDNQQQLSTADEITKLNDLKEKGIITDDEFQIKKKQLLGL